MRLEVAALIRAPDPLLVPAAPGQPAGDFMRLWSEGEAESQPAPSGHPIAAEDARTASVPRAGDAEADRHCGLDDGPDLPSPPPAEWHHAAAQAAAMPVSDRSDTGTEPQAATVRAGATLAPGNPRHITAPAMPLPNANRPDGTLEPQAAPARSGEEPPPAGLRYTAAPAVPFGASCGPDNEPDPQAAPARAGVATPPADPRQPAAPAMPFATSNRPHNEPDPQAEPTRAGVATPPADPQRAAVATAPLPVSRRPENVPDVPNKPDPYQPAPRPQGSDRADASATKPVPFRLDPFAATTTRAPEQGPVPPRHARPPDSVAARGNIAGPIPARTAPLTHAPQPEVRGTAAPTDVRIEESAAPHVPQAAGAPEPQRGAAASRRAQTLLPRPPGASAPIFAAPSRVPTPPVARPAVLPDPIVGAAPLPTHAGTAPRNIPASAGLALPVPSPQPLRASTQPAAADPGARSATGPANAGVRPMPAHITGPDAQPPIPPGPLHGGTEPEAPPPLTVLSRRPPAFDTGRTPTTGPSARSDPDTYPTRQDLASRAYGPVSLRVTPQEVAEAGPGLAEPPAPDRQAAGASPPRPPPGGVEAWLPARSAAAASRANDAPVAAALAPGLFPPTSRHPKVNAPAATDPATGGTADPGARKPVSPPPPAQAQSALSPPLNPKPHIAAPTGQPRDIATTLRASPPTRPRPELQGYSVPGEPDRTPTPATPSQTHPAGPPVSADSANWTLPTARTADSPQSRLPASREGLGGTDAPMVAQAQPTPGTANTRPLSTPPTPQAAIPAPVVPLNADMAPPPGPEPADPGSGPVSGPAASPDPAAARPETAAPRPPPAPSQQIAEAMRLAIGNRLDLTLAPEELGRLTLSFQPDGDGVRVHLVAERAETLDLLRRHAPELATELRAAGYDSASFSFGRSGPGPGTSRADGADPQADAPADNPASAPARARPTLAAGTLDLRL